jgi:hypothetical protein
MLEGRKEKKVLWDSGEFAHTFKHPENCLEHWFTVTYIVNSKTVEMETALCPVHQQGLF